jgi:hypothetical protein
MPLFFVVKPAVRITGAWIAALCLYAQAPATQGKDAQVNELRGLLPRATPSDYQAQALAGGVTIAAEFVGNAVPTADGVYNTEEYVVVETALFGAPEPRLKLTTNDFSLRVNGKKAPFLSVPSELVLKSLKDPNWGPPVPAEAKSKTSFGGGGQGDSTPAPVHMPIELQRVMSQRVQRAALLEGDRTLPQAGLLFFQYRAKSIRSVELIYSGPAGQATLKLQP